MKLCVKNAEFETFEYANLRGNSILEQAIFSVFSKDDIKGGVLHFSACGKNVYIGLVPQIALKEIFPYIPENSQGIPLYPFTRKNLFMEENNPVFALIYNFHDKNKGKAYSWSYPNKHLSYWDEKLTPMSIYAHFKKQVTALYEKDGLLLVN